MSESIAPPASGADVAAQGEDDHTHVLLLRPALLIWGSRFTMNSSDFQEALQLLDSATALLQRRGRASPAELAAELRRLSLALDLLRARVSQVPADTRRN